MSKNNDVVTIHNIGKNGEKSVTKYKINDDGTLGKKVSSGEKTIRHAKENKMTLLPNGGCVPYAVFNGDCNDNLVAIAASGGGKTRSVVEPNIISETGSMIISDPKGYLYDKYAEKLKADGYDVKHLDTIHPGDSMRYNPLDYISGYDSIIKYATTMVYLNSNKYSHADPFWEKSSVLLLCAVIGYIYEDGRDKAKAFRKILSVLSTIDANKMADGEPCAFTRLFECHNEKYMAEHNNRTSWAYEQYIKFLNLVHLEGINPNNL